MLWCVVSWVALSWCVTRRCAAVPCAVLPGVVPCIAVQRCVLGPFHCSSGAGWRRGWLDWPVSWCATLAEVMWLAGGWGARLGVAWLVGSVMQGSGCAAPVGGSGGCPRGCPPCALVPCPVGVLAPSPGCCGCLLFLFWCLCGGPCCGRGRRLAVRACWWAVQRCSRRLPWRA